MEIRVRAGIELKMESEIRIQRGIKRIRCQGLFCVHIIFFESISFFLTVSFLFTLRYV